MKNIVFVIESLRCGGAEKSLVTLLQKLDYKKYFPKMTEKEITENSEVVQSYMEKLMAYDVSETFSREGDGNFVIKDKRKKSGKVNGFYAEGFNY